MNKRIKLVIPFILTTLLFLSGCSGQDYEKEILGSWFSAPDVATWEFHEDNSLTLRSYFTGLQLSTLQGTYEIMDDQTLAVTIQKLNQTFPIKSIAKGQMILLKKYESGKDTELMFNQYEMKDKGLLGKWNIENGGVKLLKRADQAKQDIEFNGALEFFDDCTAKYTPTEDSELYQGKIYFEDERKIVMQFATEDGNLSFFVVAKISMLNDAACELDLYMDKTTVQLSRIKP